MRGWIGNTLRFPDLTSDGKSADETAISLNWKSTVLVIAVLFGVSVCAPATVAVVDMLRDGGRGAGGLNETDMKAHHRASQ